MRNAAAAAVEQRARMNDYIAYFISMYFYTCRYHIKDKLT